jgi:predicted O-methyltransferase YrrM
MFVSNFRAKTLVQTAILGLAELADYAIFHPGRAMRRQALDDSIEYLRSLPVLPPSFPSSGQLLKFAIREAHPKGSIVELGVFRGGTIRFIARNVPSDRPIHGFDTFRGLPTAWSGSSTMFDAGGVPPKVPANVFLHVGLFADTLPGWVDEHPDPIALLHIDCDLYESTACGLRCLAPRIREGTIIVFDEYFNYPGWQQHEFKAFREFADEYDVTFTPLGYASVQMAVRVDRIRPPSP